MAERCEERYQLTDPDLLEACVLDAGHKGWHEGERWTTGVVTRWLPAQVERVKVNDAALAAGMAALKQRLTWPSLHWRVAPPGDDSWPHVNKAVIDGATPAIRNQTLEDAADIVEESAEIYDWHENAQERQAVLYAAEVLRERARKERA